METRRKKATPRDYKVPSTFRVMGFRPRATKKAPYPQTGGISTRDCLGYFVINSLAVFIAKYPNRSWPGVANGAFGGPVGTQRLKNRVQAERDKTAGFCRRNESKSRGVSYPKGKAVAIKFPRPPPPARQCCREPFFTRAFCTLAAFSRFLLLLAGVAKALLVNLKRKTERKGIY